jgi:hypothetical protein
MYVNVWTGIKGRKRRIWKKQDEEEALEKVRTWNGIKNLGENRV